MKNDAIFHRFAEWVHQERRKDTFVESVLQHAFVDHIKETVWADVAPSRIKGRNSRGADIVLHDAATKRPCLLVELKHAAELSPAHQDQARRYSEEHEAPCILTNGFEYLLVFSLRKTGEFSHAGVTGLRSDSGAMIIQLGEIDPRRHHEALERQLRDLFVTASLGFDETMGAIRFLQQRTALPVAQAARLGSATSRLLPGTSRQRAPDGATNESKSISGKGRKDLDPDVAAQDALPFKPNSALSVARAIKRLLKGMPLNISEDSNERATICLGKFHIVRITQFQLHCRISVRQNDAKAARGTELTARNWRTDTIASRDLESIEEAAALVRKLWGT